MTGKETLQSAFVLSTPAFLLKTLFLWRSIRAGLCIPKGREDFVETFEKEARSRLLDIDSLSGRENFLTANPVGTAIDRPFTD
jgi:hypothetical protein